MFEKIAEILRNIKKPKVFKVSPGDYKKLVTELAGGEWDKFRFIAPRIEGVPVMPDDKTPDLEKPVEEIPEETPEIPEKKPKKKKKNV